MKLQEFLEKYSEFTETEKKFNDNSVHSGLVQLSIFKKHFPEALQDFAYKICQQQRDNCAAATGFDSRFSNGILNAEQPKIDEL
jgi:hypothetical protein